ncbi:MAG: LysM peptidoglycan-binding domain-containing protein [Anaerolineales bacterium]
MKTLSHTAAQNLIQSGRPLTEQEQTALNKHLSDCESCRAYADFHQYLHGQLPAAFPEPHPGSEKQRARVRAVQDATRRATMQNRRNRTLQLAGSLLLLAVLVVAVGWVIRSLAPQPGAVPLASGTPTATRELPPTVAIPATSAQEAYPAPPVRTPAPVDSCVVNALGWAYTYTVQPGDTLYHIATNSNTSVAELMMNNCLPSSYILKVGEVLFIFTPAASSTITPAPLTGACVPNARGWSGMYTVQEGDTLLLIASTYGLTPDQLFSANCLDTEHMLAIGDVLHVPAPGELMPYPASATPESGQGGQAVITAESLRVNGFSPDATWLAYWLTAQIDPSAPNYPRPPGELHFYDPHTGAACAYPGIQTDAYAPGAWLADGRFLVETGGQPYVLRPCVLENTLSAAEYAALLPPEPDPGLSVDGRYQASTAEVSSQDGILQMETTLNDAASGQTLIRVPWTRFDALGELGLGGEWVSPSVFLVYETIERGPLLIELEPAAQVVEVAPELFGVAPVVDADTENYTGLVAYGAPHPTLAGEYHLLLSGTGMEAAFPNVRLYHSENGMAEELSYTHLGGNGFGPAGAWLLLVRTDSSSGYEQRSYFTRPVDPQGSPPSLLAQGPDALVWLLAAQAADNRVALGWNDGRVQVQAFPEGEFLLEADTTPYSAVYLNWSPDGRLLAVSGYRSGSGPAMGLQVLAVP